MKIITIDFETFWDSKQYTLSKMGPLSYIRDPRFHAQLMGVRVDRGEVRVFEAPDIPAVLKSLELHRADRMVVGHNLNGFDAMILSEVFGIRPACMVDTMSMGRWIGILREIGGSHAALTEFLKNGHKRAGTVISDGKQWPDGFTQAEQEDFKQYCAEDVLQCSENFYKLLPYVTKDMLYFTSLTAKMATEPLLEIDEALLKEHIEHLDNATEQARRDVETIFSFPDRETFLKGVRSAASFCKMLQALGVEPPMKLSEKKSATEKAKLEELAAQGDFAASEALAFKRYEIYTPALAKTDLEFLELRDHPDPRVQLLVNTRLEQNSSIQRSRAERLLAAAGKPMPVMLSAFKADTSRYTAGTEGTASDGLQTQNLSKRDPNQLALRRAIKAPAGYKVVAADSSQIEARMLAYMAGQDDLVRIFREGRDPYSEMAANFGMGMTADEIKTGAKSGNSTAKMYRNVGKTAVLSCLSGITSVLTDTGWKPIVTVTKNDKLWDGEAWVAHDGVICNGKKNTIELAGLRLTEDHLLYDGFSWKTAGEFLNEPSYLRSGTIIAGASYATLLSNLAKENPEHTIMRNASIAERIIGSLNMRCAKHLKDIVSTVRHVLLLTCGASHHSILTSRQELRSQVRRLLFLLQREERLKYRVVTALEWSEWFLSVVIAELNHIGFTSLILGLAKQRGVMRARNVRQGLHRTKNTMVTPIYARTKHIGGDSWHGSMPALADAKIQTMRTIVRMVDEVLNATLLPVESFSRILSHFPTGIQSVLNSTESIMMGTTKLGICGLYRVTRMHETSVQCESCKQLSTPQTQKTQHYESVYDILNAGPNNRFMVQTSEGPLLVHNCGYGVGWKKFSDTLMRQGTKLHNDPATHQDMAQYCHSVYRRSVPQITGFWKRCQEVLELLAAGHQGAFGGPNDNSFMYGLYPLIDGGEPVPTVMMPSGFKLRYPGLRLKINDDGKKEYVYDRIRGRNRIEQRIYGGSLTENCIQSVSFQLLMWQACRMAEYGVQLKGNVHDSWYTVVPEQHAEGIATLMKFWMSEVPSWLPDFPVACEVEIGDDFTVA